MFFIMTSSTMKASMRRKATNDYEDSASYPEAQDSTYATPPDDDGPRIRVPNNKSIDIHASGQFIRPAFSHTKQTEEVQIRRRSSEGLLDLGRPPYLPGRASSAPKARSASLGYMKATLASTTKSTARSASPTMIPRPSSAGAPQRPVSASRIATMSREVSNLRIPATSKGIGLAPEVTEAMASSTRVTMRKDVQSIITRSRERREQIATGIATRSMLSTTTNQDS